MPPVTQSSGPPSSSQCYINSLNHYGALDIVHDTQQAQQHSTCMLLAQTKAKELYATFATNPVFLLLCYYYLFTQCSLDQCLQQHFDGLSCCYQCLSPLRRLIFMLPNSNS